MLHVVSEDEIAGFRETLPRPVLLFVLDFAVFVLAFLAQSVQESQVQALLVFAEVVSETDDVVRPEVFLALFSSLTTSLRWRWSFVSQSSLGAFPPLLSLDGVSLALVRFLCFSFISLIVVRFRKKLIVVRFRKKNCKKEIVLAKVGDGFLISALTGRGNNCKHKDNSQGTDWECVGLPTPRQNVLLTRGLTLPAQTMRVRPLFKTLLFWRIKFQQHLPAGNFKKVKTYKENLGPEKSVLGN